MAEQEAEEREVAAATVAAAAAPTKVEIEESLTKLVNFGRTCFEEHFLVYCSQIQNI